MQAMAGLLFSVAAISIGRCTEERRAKSERSGRRFGIDRARSKGVQKEHVGNWEAEHESGRRSGSLGDT